MLKPQDIVILAKILSAMSAQADKTSLSQNNLATFLFISASEINAGMKRLVKSTLLSPMMTNDPKNKILFLPNKPACEECFISGIKYFFPAKLGSYTRGIATSYTAPLFKQHLILGDDPILVWPYIEGDMNGVALEPLYPSVPESIAKFPDPFFYELLVLIDTIRSRKARERNIAIRLLKEKIHGEH